MLIKIKNVIKNVCSVYPYTFYEYFENTMSRHWEAVKKNQLSYYKEILLSEYHEYKKYNGEIDSYGTSFLMFLIDYSNKVLKEENNRGK